MANAKHPGEIVCRKVRQQHLATLTRKKHRPTWYDLNKGDRYWQSLSRQWAEYGRQMAVKAGIIPNETSIKAEFKPADQNDYRHIVRFYRDNGWNHISYLPESYEIPHRVYDYKPDETYTGDSL